MNFRLIFRIIGFILLFEAVFMLVPVITALVYQESQVWHFVSTMAVCAGLGVFLVNIKAKLQALFAKEGMVIVATSWIVLSLFGAIPFYISGSIPSYIDALFETVSGFTTTGSTIMPTGASIEALPKCMLMWRSFTHWIGGMGVIVFIMVFLPLSGGRNINLMKAESTGPSVGKLVPRMRSTAGILYLIYTALTVLQFVLLVFDMPVFDAINTAFATAGTGGFAIKGDSFASYSSYSQIVVTVFMLLFSVNFTCYFLLLLGRVKDAWNTEVKVFFAIVFVSIAAITLNTYLTMDKYTFGEALKHAAFSVASVISTTGFATEDFAILWPAFSQTILVVIMFVGACAGSTGGGMKVSRMIILYKGATHEMKRLLHPKQVKKITIDNRVVDHEVVRGVNAYLFAYILIYVMSMLFICLDCQDLLTNFTAVSATFNNIGPGLGAVGPSGTFGFYSDFSKLVFIFDMLAGRLEVFPMLLLFAPSTWRK